MHSSLKLGNSIYVCGGQSSLDENELLDSIERLQDVRQIFYSSSRWETLIIRTPQKMKNFLMLPFAADEILFLGGRTFRGVSFVEPCILRISGDSGPQINPVNEIETVNYASQQNTYRKIDGKNILAFAQDKPENPWSYGFLKIQRTEEGQVNLGLLTIPLQLHR